MAYYFDALVSFFWYLSFAFLVPALCPRRLTLVNPVGSLALCFAVGIEQ